MNYAVLYLVRIDQLWFWAIFGAVGGLVLFYRGFRVLQRKRLILNTPTSKIRSASLGLVEVSGLARGPYLIKGPISGKDCYFYRTLAWELRKSGKNEEWHKVADESLHVPFYVDDNTGLLLVNPQGAETDLHRDFREEYSNSFFSSNEMPLAVHSFLIRYGVSGQHRVRVEEYCIKPKNALFILGTLAENPGLEVSPTPVRTQTANLARLDFQLGRTDANISVSLERNPGALIPSLTVNDAGEREVINLSSAQGPMISADMTQQGKIAAALLKAGISNPAAWSAAGINDPSAAIALASGRELPTMGADGTGAAPAPEQFDLHPKVVLMKGQNNPAFFISWRSQREVVRSLGWKSIAYIWGGPALTLLSVYFLLERAGWL